MSLSNKAILQAISQDRMLGIAMMFPHRHPQRSPAMHIEVVDLLRSKDENVLIEAFREAGKSTLTEEFILLEAAFKNFRYALIIGETYTKACQRLDAIKREASTNMRLYNLFGKLKGDAWSENKIRLANGVVLEAIGWDQEHRGYKVDDARPDRAYLDDIENKTMVRDVATVNYNWKRLWTELVPAMDKDNRKIRMMGTPLAEDCMISRARNDPSFTCGRFPICSGDIDDPDTVATWPERYPMEWIKKERDKFERNGLLRSFLQEYMLIAAETQSKPFEEDHIVYMDVAPHGWAPRDTIIDPARTANIETSDETGSVVVSKVGSTFYVHESSGDFYKPDAIINRAFDLQKRQQTRNTFIEKNSLDEWLLQPIREEGLKRGEPLRYKPISAPQDRDKDTFIMGLQPYFEAREIVLVGGKNKHSKLVSQILNFPAGKRDVINALAYVTRIYSSVPVYEEFGAANIIEDYEPLKSDPLVLGVNVINNDITAVLAVVQGREITVLADWISSQAPSEAIPDISTIIRATFPQNRLSVWVTSDVYDQSDRHPLISALRRAKLNPMRGNYAAKSRGELSPFLRTELHRRRMFLVDSRAVNTLNALAGGYSYPMRKGGAQAVEPERNAYRALMESIESFTSVIVSQNNDQALPDSGHFNKNPQGVEYISSLPRRR